MKYVTSFTDFLILEGGNAFPEAGSIARGSVERVFAQFKAAMEKIFDSPEMELIGSWRQKEISGDLDTLFYSDLTLPQISQQLEEAGFETKIFYGFNIVSVHFKPSEEQSVQFDLFVRPLETNRAANDLFYKSPDDEQYSTKHRVFLIFCALDSMKFDKEYSGETLTRFKGYMLRPDGLYEFTKELKRTNYKMTEKQKLTDDLNDISTLLFGKALPYKEWNTYEKTLYQLRQNPALDMTFILQEYRKKLEEEGLTLPSEIS